MIRCLVKFDGDLLRELQNMGASAKPRAKKILSRMVDGVVLRARELAPDDPEGKTPDLMHSIRGDVRNWKGGVRGSVIAGGTPVHSKLSAEGRKNPANHDLYVVVQHEDTTLKHSRGQANFIGEPFMARLPGMAEEFDKELLDA